MRVLPFFFRSLQVTLGSRPRGPLGPTGPVAPVGPVGPVGPVAPVAPSWPAGPGPVVGAAAPVPLSATSCGEPGALSVNRSTAERAPVVVGANLTFTAQLWFGTTVAWSHASVVLMKSSVLEPTILTLLTFSAMSPAVFERMTLCGSPIVVAGWLPNVSAVGARAAAATAEFRRTDAPPGVPNFVAARSKRPSPFRSAAMTEFGVGTVSEGPATRLLPVLRSTLIRLGVPLFATVTSARPSPLRSPTATPSDMDPVVKGEPVMCTKRPTPLPRKTDELFELSLAVARSGVPSSFTSPIAMLAGPLPAVGPLAVGNGDPTAGRNPTAPLPPLPSSTFTVLDVGFATAMSSRASPFRSPMASPCGKVLLPSGIGEAGATANWPLPMPTRIPTPAGEMLAVARSANPSALKSPVAT